jgi:molecular chaperone GrpE
VTQGSDQGGGPKGIHEITPGFGELEETVRKQAARIDELTRAYAALTDDNRAFRRRMEQEKARVVDAEKAKVALVLLEALDDLELAWSASRAAGGDESPALRDLREGVRLTASTLQKRVAELGGERLDVLGKPFDPRTADGIDTVPVADAAEDGVVLHEYRPGWRMGDRVLRPARVRVGKLTRA